MILTVTANSALDKVIFIDEFRPTTVMQAKGVAYGVGGKGFDTSVTLQGLGVPNTAIGFLAGRTGAELKDLLDHYGIQSEIIYASGETRTAHVIMEQVHQRHSHIMTGGYEITPGQLDSFFDRFETLLAGVRWVVASGSLPDGFDTAFYGEITRRSHAAGASVLIDSRGKPVLQALAECPDVLKMNRDEFHATFGIQEADLARLAVSARRVLERCALPALVITCGEDGLLAVLPGCSYHAAAPLQEVVNAAGAGDGASAALAWRLSLNDGWEQALRWAAAVSAAVVLTEGTAEVRLADAERLYPQVILKQLL